MTQYKDGSIFKEVLNIKDGLADKASSSHTNPPSDITGITEEIASIAEAEALSALATKVDKVSGKQLSTEDYTSSDKTKPVRLMVIEKA